MSLPHGKLRYLNYALPMRQAWRADREGNVIRAYRFWPEARRSYRPPRS